MDENQWPNLSKWSFIEARQHITQDTIKAQLVNLFPSKFEIVMVKGSCFNILQLTGFWHLWVTPQETLHLKMSCLIHIFKAVTERSLVEEIGSETAYQSTIRPICGSKSLTCSRRKINVNEPYLVSTDKKEFQLMPSSMKWKYNRQRIQRLSIIRK